MDVWQLIEDAPVTLADTCDLYSWSSNYDAGNGPFALFLDMIGYSDDEYGTPIYGPTMRMSQPRDSWSERPGSWDENLGYVELDKLGRALREYAIRPRDVRAFVDQLMRAESGE